MDWILIGIVAGSLVTGQFASKEACLGRAATLRELKIEAKCVEAPSNLSNFVIGGSVTTSTATCSAAMCTRCDSSGHCY